MRLLHISDLHIGKKVKGFSLIDDQRYILDQILDVCKQKNVDGIIIAGDIYDLSVPSTEAVNCFDKFISELHSLGISCFAVSGNHDSVSRIAFGSDIMAKEKMYFAKKYCGTITPIQLDEDIFIWLLPFIRPVDVREFYPDFENCSYEDMMHTVLSNLKINKNMTNILVAHQFVTCNGIQPERSESEGVSLGTLDNIDFSVFDTFDYVALGHIHKPQIMGRKTVRYSGSPIKYSFSEKNDIKSMVLLDICQKNIKQELIPYTHMRDMKEFVGTYEELKNLPKSVDYARIVLKDENFIADIKQKLEMNFTNIMEIVYDNTFTRENQIVNNVSSIDKKSPLDLYRDFFELQNNRTLNKEELKIIENLLNDMGVYEE